MSARPSTACTAFTTNVSAVPEYAPPTSRTPRPPRHESLVHQAGHCPLTALRSHGHTARSLRCGHTATLPALPAATNLATLHQHQCCCLSLVMRTHARTHARTHVAGKARYSVKLWKAFNNCFNYMPLAAVVDDSIFCVGEKCTAVHPPTRGVREETGGVHCCATSAQPAGAVSRMFVGV